MFPPNLEQRVAELEQQMARLLPRTGSDAPSQPGPDAWRTTVGMFDGDPIFREMLDEARRVREAAPRSDSNVV